MHNKTHEKYVSNIVALPIVLVMFNLLQVDQRSKMRQNTTPIIYS